MACMLGIRHHGDAEVPFGQSIAKRQDIGRLCSVKKGHFDVRISGWSFCYRDAVCFMRPDMTSSYLLPHTPI